MFSKKFQRKYALTDQGLKNTKTGAFWTVITNLVVMGGMGILYLLMGAFMETLTDGAPLPGAVLPVALTVGFVLLSFVTHLQQYRATYGLVYGEVKTTRLRRSTGPPTAWCTVRSRPPACAWRSGCGSCPWATSVSGTWRT